MDGPSVVLGINVGAGVTAGVERVVEASDATVIVGVADVLAEDIVLGEVDPFDERQSHINK